VKRIRASRAQPELLEALRSRLEPLAAEPAEQLLRPVVEEDTRHREA
jgi:hypothetical protein